VFYCNRAAVKVGNPSFVGAVWWWVKCLSFSPSFLSDPKLKNRQAGFANNDENGEK
jgi:hypothetical protein